MAFFIVFVVVIDVVVVVVVVVVLVVIAVFVVGVGVRRVLLNVRRNIRPPPVDSDTLSGLQHV